MLTVDGKEQITVKVNIMWKKTKLLNPPAGIFLLLDNIKLLGRFRNEYEKKNLPYKGGTLPK